MLSLPALRADSLLGYLAALGVCRLTNCRLAWQHTPPLWTAKLETDLTIHELAESLLSQCKSSPLSGLEVALKLTVDEWLSLTSDWSAAVGTEDKNGFRIAPIIAARGGGHQYPVATIDKVSSELTLEDVESALVGPWRRHPKLGLRWEASEWRRHGDEWGDPSKTPTLVARGPTRLAVEALPLVPTLSPSCAAMFHGRKQDRVRWPVWSEWLTPAAVRGRVLAGIGEMLWECERHLTGKAQYSFTLPRAVRCGP